ncbi:NAD(P)/FAD-dependent oxidoreductase [Aspergillus saccharolyticus JOP 1030-1]|uniref:FAD/NAD(P)-binding domain-containing protein n=1 Tax=Aspergillus saccharolyticus JOP 1030-1 TaxID=1450539 RepID=A0A318ZQ08_9EURO|nr:FAD/NAD(P)-binding domain-containing protein [Aspergillus saccharolyticus JOP 1030-1]PYH49689.1 FAD/NAD(P)-binding domain-containing protein [Aspergillus saccharolyticus JOP 1030-1]
MMQNIPDHCMVLVVGGGPGGSYCAAALAREGVDTVLLEADQFPRYHIGESMLASMRHLLRFIDLDQAFDKYGFTKKIGASFKLDKTKRAGYTDFLAAGGRENYAWNVVRSEADHLMFQHAAKSGAKTFDGVKVKSIQFAPDAVSKLGKPVSATYVCQQDQSQEIKEISFNYLVDASGRKGMLSTKYLNNRRYNESLKNIAHWGYWQGAETYAKGTPMENQPFFETLHDESGWVWLIPLHNGTVSVGIVRNQKTATAKKRESGLEQKEFYHDTLGLAPEIQLLLGRAELVSPVKSACDYSYSASSYAMSHARIVGDAGCFIDPYFSSGVHLALVGGLSAATTICAALRGDCDEAVAASWHSDKVSDSYVRFMLVVMSAYQQIRGQSKPVLRDLHEDNFDRAFGIIRPIIQGTADVNPDKITQEELDRTIKFCAAAHGAEDDIRHHVRKLLRTEDSLNIDSFSTDEINGFVPNLKQGNLGLVKCAA